MFGSPFLRFPLVSILCDASEGHQSIVEKPSKKGCFGGGQKGSKKGQKRGKIENDFFKVWKKRSKGSLPPHLA